MIDTEQFTKLVAASLSANYQVFLAMEPSIDLLNPPTIGFERTFLDSKIDKIVDSIVQDLRSQSSVPPEQRLELTPESESLIRTAEFRNSVLEKVRGYITPSES